MGHHGLIITGLFGIITVFSLSQSETTPQQATERSAPWRPERPTIVEDSGWIEHVAEVLSLKSSLYSRAVNVDGEMVPPGGTKRELIDLFAYYITSVDFRADPKRIVKMDIETQTLSLLVSEEIFWTDTKMIFDANSTFYVKLNASSMWTPPIVPSEVVDMSVVEGGDEVTVDANGLCYFPRTVLYSIPCAVNVRDFPFDIHVCSFLYITRLFSSNHLLDIRVTRHREDGKTFVVGENGLFFKYNSHLEWHGLKANITKIGMSMMNYTISVQRRSQFYAIVLIFPTVLLNILSLVVFTLPVDTTERENFILTLILTYFVMLLIIVDSSPPTGDEIPDLGMYIIMSTGICLLTFGFSLILIEIHEHKRAKQRVMSKGCFWVLQKCCCFKPSYKVSQKAQKKQCKESSQGVNGQIDDDMEDFKWKLLVKILNYLFFALTLIAHIVVPCVIYLS